MSYLSVVRLLDSQGNVINPAKVPDQSPATEETLQLAIWTIEDLLKRLRIQVDGSSVVQPVAGTVSVSSAPPLAITSMPTLRFADPNADDAGRIRIVDEEQLASEDTLYQILTQMLTDDTFRRRMPEPVSMATSVYSVTSSVSNVTLLPARANRRMASVVNDSSSVLYLKCGITAARTSYSVQLAPMTYFEFPQPIYIGQVDGIWDIANGAAYITEYT